MPTLEELSAEVRAKAQDQIPEVIALMDKLLDAINDGMTRLSGTPNDSGVRFLQMLLVNRGFSSLYRGREDAVCGYPTQAMTMARAALEDWGTLEYVEKHPEENTIWLKEIVPEAAGETRSAPRFVTIWDDLGAALATEVKDAYGNLSAFAAHPRPEGMGGH